MLEVVGDEIAKNSDENGNGSSNYVEDVVEGGHADMELGTN